MDKTTKIERQIQRGDPEYYGHSEQRILGQNVQFFTKNRPMLSKFDTFCSLKKCKEVFVPGESRIIGVKLYNKKTIKYEYKPGTNKYYYICASHRKYA